MLRTVVNSGIRPRFQSHSFDLADSGATLLSNNAGDFASYSNAGGGALTLALKHPYGFEPIVVATCDNGAGAGAACQVVPQTDPAKNIVIKTSLPTSGNLCNPKVNLFIFGWDSKWAHGGYHGRNPVNCSRPSGRLIPICITDPATLSKGTYVATASKNTSGQIGYNVAALRPFFYAPQAVATSYVGGVSSRRANSWGTPSITTVGVKHHDLTSEIGCDTHMIIAGQDLGAKAGGFNRALKVAGWLKPRIVAGQVSSAGAAVLGTQDFTVVRDGAGIYTVTFRKSFKTTPVSVATPVSSTVGRSITIAARGVSSIQVRTFNASDAATDCAFNFFVLGSDSGDQFA